jgi:hypothetical protein
MECPDCSERLVWNSDIETEDVEGVSHMETLYHCHGCTLEMVLLRKIPDETV